MKPDKRALAEWMLAGKKPREFEALGLMHDNRLYSILDKWTNKGWIDYGVSVRYAWLTDEGKAALRARLAPPTS